MWNSLLNTVGAVGNVLDLPGSSVRDALAGRNALDQWMTPLTDKNRTSGRDLLRVHGLASNKDTWGNFAGGMLAEAALDPLNFVPGMSVAKAARAKGAAQAANRGIDAANALSMSQRAAGFMPEEVVQHLHPSVLESPGVPKKFYHGGPDISFQQYDPNRLDPHALYGKGIYATDAPHVAGGGGGYWSKGRDKLQRYEVPEQNRQLFDELAGDAASDAHDSIMRLPVADAKQELFDLIPAKARSMLQVVEPPAGVKMHYMDVRKPLNIEGIAPELPTWPSGEFRLDSDVAPRMRVRQLLSTIKGKQRTLAPGANVRISQAMRAEQQKLLDAARSQLPDAFRKRNSNGLLGIDVYERAGEAGVPLPDIGYDAITHTGGQVTGSDAHNVVIAFSPEQMHLPYIAKAIQPLQSVPKITPAMMRLAMYNAAARTAAQGGRTK